MNNILISISSNLAYFLLLYYLCIKIYNRKDNVNLIMFLILAIIKSVFPVNPIISIIFYTICLIMFDRKNLFKNLALNVLIIALFMSATLFSESLTLVLLSLFTGLSVNIIVNMQLYMIIGNIICLLVQGILVSCMISVFKLYRIVPKAYTCVILAILPLSMILIVIALEPLILAAPKVNVFLALSLLLFLIATSTLLYIFASIVKNIDYKHKYEIEVRKQALDAEYYRHFNVNVEKLKIIKHDVEKHYRSLNNLLSTGNTEEALRYIKNISKDTQLAVLDITGIKQIDMVLYTYQDIFIEHDIEVKYNIQDIAFDDIEPADMTIILGNILDNAIYSCVNSEVKKIKIILASHPPHRILKVVNSCDNVKRINEKYISIKRNGDTSYGLESIQRCANKYNAYCIFDHDKDNHTFTTSVIFSGR